ncbi:MAG: tetratricopeptide repeat protein [Spirochaetales bacterium]|nr:tetratricopeptide repeat protein [Spirochaetales bacterium]
MEEKKPKGLTLFFTRFGKVFIGFSVLVLIIVSGVVVYNEVQNSRKAAATELVESMEAAYQDYLSDANSTKSASTLEELAAKAIADFPQEYPAQRGQFLLAMRAEAQEDFITASELFESSALIGASSHLIEVAYIRSYQTAESAGELPRAVAMLQALLNAAPLGIQAPRAIFNLGRLYELIGNTESALDTFRRLTLEFPGSSWTSLSEARILQLENS